MPTAGGCMALDTGGGSSEGAGLQAGEEDVPSDLSVRGVWRIPAGGGGEEVVAVSGWN